MADETAAAATPAPETSSEATLEANGAKRKKLLRILAYLHHRLHNTRG